MHQEAVHGRVAVELVDRLEQVVLSGGGGDADVHRSDAIALARFVLAGYVVGAGRVVTHQDGTQADDLAGLAEGGHPRPYPGQYCVRDRRAGHDDRAHSTFLHARTGLNAGTGARR